MGFDKIRVKPSFFAFTEPSLEIEAWHPEKKQWVELGGAGMVHPNVLKAGKIDTTKYSGFAFGWGVERTYMMKSGIKIDDLRLLYSNDIRFLTQF